MISAVIRRSFTCRARARAEAPMPNLSLISMPSVTPISPGLQETMRAVSLRLSERTAVFEMVNRV